MRLRRARPERRSTVEAVCAWPIPVDGDDGGARTMGNCDPDERRIGLALAPVRKGLPGSSIRGAEPRIICVDAMDSMGRCRRRTRSHYAYRQGKLCRWRRRAAEADGE